MILLRPLWLLALLAVAALAVALWRRGPDAGGWESVLSPQMRAGLAALGRFDTGARGLGRYARFAPLAGAAALVIGLSGPALPRADAPVFAQSDAVVIAMDMSPSVAEGEALADAQAAAAGLSQALAGRPVGLILYAGEAYAVAAPTADPATLESQIAVLGPETMPDESSRPAAAMAMAGQMLARLRRADLVLISDGGGIDDAALAEASRLQAAGVRISALSVAGNPASDLSRLALIADGAVSHHDTPAPVVRFLASSGASRDAAMTALQYRDLGPWFAVFALLGLVPHLRRRA